MTSVDLSFPGCRVRIEVLHVCEVILGETGLGVLHGAWSPVHGTDPLTFRALCRVSDLPHGGVSHENRRAGASRGVL